MRCSRGSIEHSIHSMNQDRIVLFILKYNGDSQLLYTTQNAELFAKDSAVHDKNLCYVDQLVKITRHYTTTF